jgi:hypothetical protein
MENQNVNHRRTIKNDDHSFGKINQQKSNNYSDNKIQTFSQTESVSKEEEKDSTKIQKDVISIVENLNQKDPKTLVELIELLNKLVISKESAAGSRKQSPENNRNTISKIAGNKLSSTIEFGHNMKRGSLPNNDIKNTFQASPMDNTFDSQKIKTRKIRDFKVSQPDSRNSELVRNPMGISSGVNYRLRKSAIVRRAEE